MNERSKINFPTHDRTNSKHRMISQSALRRVRNSLTMATEALERQQTKKRVKSAVEHRPTRHPTKPTLRRILDKNQAASPVSRLTFGNSMHSVLTAIDLESNNNPLALPFPVIRWEDDDADDDETALVQKTETQLVVREQVKIQPRKKKRCLRRSLACQHLSLLALDQIASMNEDEELQRQRKLRLMSCPY